MAEHDHDERGAAKVIALLTDGCDTQKERGDTLLADSSAHLPAWGVSVLACCIGQSCVDPGGLARLALATGGRYVPVTTPSQIEGAVAALTEFLTIRMLHAGVSLRSGSHAGESRRLVAVQATERARVDVMIVIDCSSTMGGQAFDGRATTNATKLSTAKRIAISLLDSLNFTRDRAGVIAIKRGARVLQGLTRNRDTCVQSLRNLSALDMRGSAIFEAVHGAASLLAPPEWYLCSNCGGPQSGPWMWEFSLLGVRCTECGRLITRDSW